MIDEILEVVPTHKGHFLLVSGYRTNLRPTADTISDSPAIAPLVAW